MKFRLILAFIIWNTKIYDVVRMAFLFLHVYNDA